MAVDVMVHVDVVDVDVVLVVVVDVVVDVMVDVRSEEHTSELQSLTNLGCRIIH